MYPFIRMAVHSVKYARAPKLPLEGVHISQHMCWPQDIDLWGELNNGRTLTLYDLGRIQVFRRIGLLEVLRREGWRLTIAGTTVRYRRRVTMFNRFEMRSRLLGRGRRFFYVKQSMWREGEAQSSAVFRMAVVGKNGIIPPETVIKALGQPGWNPPLPDWVQSWIAAENRRNWPPLP